MLYRVLETIRNKDKRIMAGTISNLKELPEKSIKLLLLKNRISEAKGPPLSILPDWREKAELLAPWGITNVVELLEADHEELAHLAGVDLKGLLASVEEARGWLEPQEGSNYIPFFV